MAGRVKLREVAAPEEAALTPLRPLRVSGLVVAKADLIGALRAFVPGLADVTVTEDGEHFWLLLGGAEATGEDQAAG